MKDSFSTLNHRVVYPATLCTHEEYSTVICKRSDGLTAHSHEIEKNTLLSVLG